VDRLPLNRGRPKALAQPIFTANPCSPAAGDSRDQKRVGRAPPVKHLGFQGIAAMRLKRYSSQLRKFAFATCVLKPSDFAGAILILTGRQHLRPGLWPMALALVWSLAAFPANAQPVSSLGPIRLTDPRFADMIVHSVDRLMGLDGSGLDGANLLGGRQGIASAEKKATVAHTPAVANDLPPLEQEILRSVCRVFHLSESQALQDPFFSSQDAGERTSHAGRSWEWPQPFWGMAAHQIISQWAEPLYHWPTIGRDWLEDRLVTGTETAQSLADVVRHPAGKAEVRARLVAHPIESNRGPEPTLVRPSGYRKPSPATPPRSAARLAPLDDEAFAPQEAKPEVVEETPQPPQLPENSPQFRDNTPLIPLERPLFWEVFSFLRLWSERSVHPVHLTWWQSEWSRTLEGWGIWSRESFQAIPTLASHYWGGVSTKTGPEPEMQPEPTASYVGLEPSIQWLLGSVQSKLEGWTERGSRWVSAVQHLPAGQKRSLSKLVLERIDAIHR
jgi:hypothetical protein